MTEKMTRLAEIIKLAEEIQIGRIEFVIGDTEADSRRKLILTSSGLKETTENGTRLVPPNEYCSVIEKYDIRCAAEESIRLLHKIEGCR